MELKKRFILSVVFSVCLTIGQGQNGFQVLNKGIGGNTSGELLDRLERDVIAEDPDLVLLMAGTNDLLNSRKMVSFEKYESHMRKILSRLREQNIDFVLMSPPPADTIYLFQRHERDQFLIEPHEKLEKCRLLVKNLSKEYGGMFIDIYGYFSGMSVPDHNRDEIFRNEKNSNARDGVHLTEKGNKILGTYIFQVLMDEGIFHKESRIVCFGDSLTFGAFMEGQGTSAGNTYPAVLRAAMERHFLDTK